MITLLILLCCVILFVDAEKMSLLPLKAALSWSLLWGIAGYFTTLHFLGLSQQESFGLLDIANISTLVFIELLIMFVYLFSGGKIKKILSCYPGLMIIVPVGVGSFFIARFLPGIDFAVTGIITACLTTIILMGLFLLFRFCRVDNKGLYSTDRKSTRLNSSHRT